MEDSLMKKIVSILVLAVMALSLVVSASAADGINKDEADLLAKFNGVVDSYAGINPGLAGQYKNEAEVALTKVDLDADAVKELSATIDKVVAYAEENGITTKEAAKKALPEVLAMVNDVAAKYGICVTVAADGSVCVTVGNADKAATSDSKLVKQTGVDMTATYIVAGVLVISLVFGLAVVSKKNLLASN